LFDEIPCKYCLGIEDPKKCLDPKEIVFEKCKHLFKDVLATRQYTEEYEEDPEGEEIEFAEGTQVELPLEELEGHLRFNGERASSLYVATENKRIFLVTLNKCSVYYSAQDSLEDIKKFVNELWNCFPKLQEEEKAARVGLIKYSNGEYYTSFSDIRKTTVNIEENYNDDFLPVHKDIVDFLNQRESGLILLYGSFGSGKTNYIRHLCSNIAKDYVIVPNSVASRLGDPDFISYITSCRDYVFILEDCEQLLMDRTDNPWNNAITTILNMADGLLSDIVNIKFICTFNADVDKIDPALLRKGRCFAKYEFGDLCEEKVAALDAKYQLSLPEIKPMTLAEVYNAEKRDYSEETKKPRKIGF
jgi:hypothetical protein